MSEDLDLVKISELPPTEHVTAGDMLPVVQNGVTKKVPPTGIRKYVTDSLGTAAFSSKTDFEPSGSVLEVDLKAQARADAQNARIARVEVAAYLLRNNKVFKAYRNKALMLADTEIPADSILTVVADPANDPELNDINGQYHWNGNDFLKLPDDILSLIDTKTGQVSIDVKAYAAQVAADAVVTAATDASDKANNVLLSAIEHSNLERKDREDLIEKGKVFAVVDQSGFAAMEINSDGVVRFYIPVDMIVKSLIYRDVQGFGFNVIDRILNIAAKSLIYRDEQGFGFDIIDRILNIAAKSLVYRDEQGFGFNVIEKLLELDHQLITKNINIQKILLSRHICIWSNESTSIYVPHILIDRARQMNTQDIIATLASDERVSPEIQSSLLLKISSLVQSGSNTLVLRNRNSDLVAQLKINVVAVPNQDSLIKIHMLGDSIVEMSGVPLVKIFLELHGYSVTTIGTYKSHGVTYDGISLSPQDNEARGGWRAASFTNTHNYGNKIVNVSEYLALSNAEKKAFNPYLRLAAEGDSSEIIRNGYVFDFADYLNKFSLDVPDIVYVGLGTNDIEQYSSEVFESQYESDMRILISQIKNAGVEKIILGQPAPAINENRNEKWKTHYQIGIRILIKLSNEFDCIFCDVHAVSTNETGFLFVETDADSETGTTIGKMNDNLHPYQQSRFAIYNKLAATIAASYQNLI